LSFENLEPSEMINRVVELLTNDKIVGWFQGRMEFGPRALGARSILASATDIKITKILNERLHRNDFMPFAPATINDTAKKCFIDWEPDHFSSRFMTLCYKCTPFLKEKCPSVVHVDNTARPQVVFQEDNPKYFELLNKYIKKTGNPVLINTSFNHHEEPIVNSPYDAVRSLLKRNVDFLAIGNHLVHKNQ
jgi:carbamoyltransferase